MLIVLYISLLIVFGVVVFLSTRNKTLYIEDVHKDEKFLSIFYPFAMFVLLTLKKWKVSQESNSQIKECLNAIHIHKNVEVLFKKHWCKKIALGCIVLICGVFLGLLIEIKGELNTELIRGNTLERSSYGEGGKEVVLNTKAKKEDTFEDSLNINIEELRYTEEEVKKQFELVKKEIDKKVLGENLSYEEIYFPLNFIQRVKDINVKISWSTDKEKVISAKGEVSNEDIPLEGVIVKAEACLKYYDYTEYYTLYFNVKQKKYTEEEKIKKLIEDMVFQEEKRDFTNSTITLPTNVDGYQVDYKEKRKNESVQVVLLMWIAAIVLIISVDKDVLKKYKKREQELLLDYPEMVNKIVLLIGAGMTVKGAWEKVTADYERKRLELKEQERYLYEEMKITYYEMKSGVTELKAYENFGKRINVLPYLKFTTLITQNLRKGTKGLLELLEKEGTDAFQNRKELAKRLGEEAGTKLLIPMVLLLGIVMATMIVPAFMTV